MGNRPHYLDVPDDELEDLSEEEKDKFIEECIQSEFENNIHFYWRKE